MRTLLLSDLGLGLEHMLAHRVEDLRRVSHGARYEQRLRAHLADARRLTRRASGRERRRPLAGALAAEVAAHDGDARALYFLLEGYRHRPSLDERVRDAAARIQRVFMPGLGELRASHADRAARAMTREGLVEEHAGAFDLIPTSDGTARDWVESVLASGARIQALLVERAAREAADSGGEGRALRVEIISLLGRLRQSVVNEVAIDPALPRDLEVRLFSFIDMLAAGRAGRAAAAAREPEAGADEAVDGPLATTAPTPASADANADADEASTAPLAPADPDAPVTSTAAVDLAPPEP